MKKLLVLITASLFILGGCPCKGPTPTLTHLYDATYSHSVIGKWQTEIHCVEGQIIIRRGVSSIHWTKGACVSVYSSELYGNTSYIIELCRK